MRERIGSIGGIIPDLHRSGKIRYKRRVRITYKVSEAGYTKEYQCCAQVTLHHAVGYKG